MKHRVMRDYIHLCRSVGVEVTEYGATGGGHLWLECRHRGMTRKIFVAATASDWRAMLNLKSIIRREFGIVPKKKDPGGAKPAGPVKTCRLHGRKPTANVTI